MPDRHPGEPGQQQRPPVVVAQQHDADDGADDADQTDGDGQEQRGAGAHAGGLQDGRRVVVHRVDAGRLLHRGQPAADPEDAPHPGERRRSRRAAPLSSAVSRLACSTMMLYSSAASRLVPAAVQHAPWPRPAGRGSRTSGASPAGRTSRRTARGRDRGDAEHPAPDVRVLDQRVQQGVHRERQELTGDDHQLVDRHHPAAPVRRGHLGQVQRAGRGRGARRRSRAGSGRRS